MEDKKQLTRIHNFFRCLVFFIVFLDIIMYIYYYDINNSFVNYLTANFKNFAIFQIPLYCKLALIFLTCLTSIGTESKKDLNFSITKNLAIPLTLGITLLFSSLLFMIGKGDGKDILPYTNFFELMYILTTTGGVIFLMVGMDNISKYIKSSFGKDKFNVEEESFLQETKKVENETSINIPTKFYYNKKIRRGWINMNPFRGIMIIGVPGSGKSFGIINPSIRQMVQKNFAICLYDFKYPDLSNIAYYHYLIKKNDSNYKYRYKVLNLDDVEYSVRVNPLDPKYIKTLAQAQETADAMVNALKKGGNEQGGSGQFFTESAINFLSSTIYFFAKYENGKYSSLPYVMAFLNLSYEKIFTVLFKNYELTALLSPFKSAFEKKAFDQLEGQIGTLKIFLSKLATKETYYIFNKEELELDIANPEHPTILVLASNPQTQNINSTLYAVVLNRVTSLLNTKKNVQSAIIADECPTIYIHKIENLIATARSNKVAVLLGLQELPQFRKQYGKDTADSIVAVIANTLSGQVKNKDTLDWLEKLLGKKNQTKESLSIDKSKTSISLREDYTPLIPAGKIANLNVGEIVGIVANDSENLQNFKTNAIHCKIDLDMNEIKNEEANYVKQKKIRQFENKEEFLLNYYNKLNKQMKNEVEKIIRSNSNE